MNRRDFFKLIAALPLLATGTKASAGERSILLLKTNVAGFRYYEGQRLWPGLRANELLRLVREPSNPHDAKAVAVYRQGEKLGYIPRADNSVIATLMDQNRVLRAFIQEKRQTPNPWERLWVRVEMIT